MEKKEFIHIDINLDEKKFPQNISWHASGNQDGEKLERAKAFFLTLFDDQSRDTMQMDIWVKDMQMIEMDRFVYQSLNALGDLYFRATKNKELANDMKKFVQYFGMQTKILS